MSDDEKPIREYSVGELLYQVHSMRHIVSFILDSLGESEKNRILDRFKKEVPEKKLKLNISY